MTNYHIVDANKMVSIHLRIVNILSDHFRDLTKIVEVTS
jgi:hypothetical protein